MKSMGGIGFPISDFDFFQHEDNISDDDQGKGINLGWSSRYCEVIKPDMDECESVNQDGSSMWSSVFEETKDLIRAQESCFSHSANHEDKKVWKGSRIKSKPKFSFSFHPEASMPLPTVKCENSINVHQDVEGLEELEHGGKEHSMSELLKDLQKEQSECEEVKLKHSMLAFVSVPSASLATSSCVSSTSASLSTSNSSL